MDTLARLYATVEARASAHPDTSYTATLLANGPAKCAEKFGEEAVEAVIAAMAGDVAELTKESADILYHLLVVLHMAGVGVQDVMDELARRTAQTGLEEKAGRKNA